ncbi:MAG: two-component regulator propeller domain-containing protein, partial [Melioribacteraceae bacterium]|nr:two-component regulator propeller domain-containing protein [Melioribacteraceae bacterium]
TLSDNFISTVTYNDNAIWLGAGRSLQSLNKLDLNTGLVSRIKISNDNQQVLGGALNEIFIDRTGIVWIAQGLTGIKYFDPTWQNYEQYLINIENFGSIENRAYGICPMSNTQLWISTFDGPKLFDLKKGVEKEIKSKDAQFLNGNGIIVNNEIWFPSRIKGIVRLNPQSGGLNFIDHGPNSNLGLSSNYVNTIIKDQEGIVWSGSRDGGLDRIHPKTKKIKSYNNVEDDPHSLPNNSVYAIYEENENELWVGTNGGLSLFNKVSEKFETYNYDPADASSISSDLISYIMKTKKGDLLIATYGGGLNRFNPEDKSFTRFTAQKENIPNNTIYSLVEDEMGYIWVSTVSGISRFSPETGYYDNLIPLIDNYKVNKFSNGKLIFSGPRGLLVFDPQQIKINSIPPLVTLTNFIVKGKTTIEERNDSLKYILSTSGIIDLEYYQNDISFEFMAAHYSNTAKNKYRVFMEGYDNDWRNLGNFGSINYTNLDPGEYKLSVMASNAYDLWSKSPVEYFININKPWWQTWWAYSIYAIIILGLLYSIRRVELNRQQKNASIKESKLRAEAAELQAKAAEAQSKVIQAENERKTKELEEAR